MKLAPRIAMSLLLSVAASHGGGTADAEILNVTGDFYVKEGSRLEIHNAQGDLRVRQSEDGMLHAVAAVQRAAGDTGEVVLELTDKGGRMRLEPAWTTPGTGSLRRVDLAVHVPPGFHLSLRTVDGLLDARGLKQDVDAETRDGRIFLRAAGRLNARTEGGAIGVHMKSPRWRGEASLRTVTGDISVRFLAPPDVRVRARTAGAIASDYSMTVRQPREERVKSAGIRARPGGLAARVASFLRRGSRMTLESEEGNISIQRPFPAMHEPEAPEGKSF